MQIVLLCAGYATRLYPLTENQPKSLLPVGGKPLLNHLLDRVKEGTAVSQMFLVTNDRFQTHFSAWAKLTHAPWEIKVVSDGTRSDKERLGALGDLVFVIRNFRLESDLGVLAGDNLFDFDLGPFFSFAESHRPQVTIGVVDVRKKDLARHYGIVRIEKTGQIVEFLEKPGNPPSTLASTGIYWFPKESLVLLDRYLKEGHNADRLGDFIAWLVKVDRVFAYPFEGIWFDIGDLNSYQEAERLFQESRNKPG